MVPLALSLDTAAAATGVAALLDTAVHLDEDIMIVMIVL